MPFHGRQGAVHWVVVWDRLGTNSDGRPNLSDVAREVDCRWDGSKRTILTPDGNSISIDATISGFELPIVEGSAVWKGRIEDIPGTAQVPVLDVMEVVSTKNVDDIRGRDTYRTATLMRQKDIL